MNKSLLSLIAAFALTIGTAAAQTTAPTTGPGRNRMEQRSPEDMAQRQGERLTKELGLNADQAAKVQQIMTARGQEMQAMRSQSREAGSRDQMREQMQANRAKYDAQFKEVLTADQYTKYAAMESNRMNRMNRGGDGMKDGKMKVKDGKVKIKKADK